MTDAELMAEIARTKALLATLYATKKARALAARSVVPRAVKVAATHKRNVEIRRLYRQEGQSCRQLGVRFGLSHYHVRHIIAWLDYEDRMAPLREKWRAVA